MKNISLKKIIKIVKRVGDIEITDNQVDVNLLELGLTSISFIQIVVELEKEYDCEIPDDKLLITEMDTIRKIFDTLKFIQIENQKIESYEK